MRQTTRFPRGRPITNTLPAFQVGRSRSEHDYSDRGQNRVEAVSTFSKLNSIACSGDSVSRAGRHQMRQDSPSRLFKYLLSIASPVSFHFSRFPPHHAYPCHQQYNVVQNVTRPRRMSPCCVCQDAGSRLFTDGSNQIHIREAVV
jgi:hypothetical protein